MKPRTQFLSLLARAIVCVTLLGFAPATGRPGSSDLAGLVSRAQDRTAWPALRDMAAGMADAEQRGRAYFVLGYREYEANEFASAAQDLATAAETGFSLGDYASYFGAIASRDAGNVDQAIKLLADFGARFPQSTLRLSALKQYSDLLVSARQPDLARKALLQEPQARDVPSLALELAEVHRATGSLNQAVRAFQDVYYRFPLSGEADEAEASLLELRKELGAKFGEATEELRSGRAEILSQNARWREALDEYTSLIKDAPKSALAPRWQLGRARALFRLRKTDDALRLLQTEVAPNPEIEPERLGLLVEISFRKSDLQEAESLLRQLQKTSPPSSNYAGALDSFGDYYVRRGAWKTAAKYYQVLADQFPSTRLGQEAHWRRSWAYYLEGDFINAQAGFSQHVNRYPASDHVPGAFYWLGRISEARGDKVEAKYWYSFITHRYVHSYYSTKAEIRLEQVLKSASPGRASDLAPAAFRALAAKIPARPGPSLRSCGMPVASEKLAPYWTLRDLGLGDLAEEYLLDRLNQPETPTSALRFTLSRHRAGNGSATLALFDARRSEPRYVEFQFEELPQEFWTLLYPRDFSLIVERYSNENSLDPALVLGLIRQESAFNPAARSVANARGLMQILPQTVSPTRKGRRTAARRLLEPEYNVRFGTAYLRGRLSRLGDVPEHALAAYHAGDRRVQEWQGYYKFQEPAEFLETIPIPATRAYVEAVLRDAGIYRKLLDGTAQFARCRSEGIPSATQQKGPWAPETMKLLPKALIVIPLILGLLVPVALGITFYLMPLWLWIELNYQIESVGHSGPADWCFVAVYVALVTVSLGTMALLTLTRPKGKAAASQ